MQISCHAAYIAGLVDADGTVSLARTHAGRNRHPIVSISNTDRALLVCVLDQVGAGKITTKKTVSVRHTLSFTYAIHSREALILLEQLQPYLKTYKSIRAQQITAQYLAVTPRDGKYTGELRQARETFEQRILDIKPGAGSVRPDRHRDDC